MVTNLVWRVDDVKVEAVFGLCHSPLVSISIHAIASLIAFPGTLPAVFLPIGLRLSQNLDSRSMGRKVASAG
jgi:hypothetical protein